MGPHSSPVLGGDGRRDADRMGVVAMLPRRPTQAARIDPGVALAARLYAAEVSGERVG